MSIPKKDSEYVPYTGNWEQRITATPTAFNLTAAQATAFTALRTPYVDAVTALDEARTAGTFAQSLTAARDAAKLALVRFNRELYSFVQGSTSVSDENKILLGVTVRAQPSPIPPPGTSPSIDVKSVSGSTINLLIHGEDALKRGKPPGVAGASVFSYIGETPPESTDAWVFQGSTTRTTFAVVLPQSASAQKVFLCAFWYSPTARSGPACTPISVNLPATTSAPPGAMKMAA